MGWKNLHGTVQKEPASCGLYGAIAIRRGRGFVKATQAKDAIELVRCDRGGTMGNGILLSYPNTIETNSSYVLLIWARADQFLEQVRLILAENPNVSVLSPPGKLSTEKGKNIWMANINGNELEIMKLILQINGTFSPSDLRIISSTKHQLLVKDLETLANLSARYGLETLHAYAVLAHTRYPTGASPISTRAHPHAFGNIGMVFNGDVKSYYVNRKMAEAMISGVLFELFKNDSELELFMATVRNSWVGSDAEVIAAPLYLLLKRGVSIPSAITALVPPFDNFVATLPRGPERDRLRRVISDYPGLQLDGAVSALVTITTDDDVQFLGFRDRNEFRPLQVLYDREDDIVHAGSEIRMLEAASGRKITDSCVESYSLEPGDFLWVSHKNGIIKSGRERRTAISVPKPPKPNGVVLVNADGRPHLFAGDDRTTGEKIAVIGVVGNGTGNYTEGGDYEFFSSIQDNAFEASRAGSVIVHGNVGMMTPNAFQGECFYVRGSGDSRTFQQTRYSQKHLPPPVGIVGERAGTHFGKMFAGGHLMVLGISQLGHEDEQSPLVGRLAFTGMMAGTGYIRGPVPRDYIGKPPSARRVLGEIKELMNDGLISPTQYHLLLAAKLDPEAMELVLRGNENALARLLSLFSNKYQKPYDVQLRELDAEEHAFLDPHLRRFCEIFKLESSILDTLLTSAYTVVKLKETEGADTHK